jgi:hypothetical protein
MALQSNIDILAHESDLLREAKANAESQNVLVPDCGHRVLLFTAVHRYVDLESGNARIDARPKRQRDEQRKPSAEPEQGRAEADRQVARGARSAPSDNASL